MAFAYRFENLRPLEEAGGPEKEQTGGTRGASRELLSGLGHIRTRTHSPTQRFDFLAVVGAICRYMKSLFSYDLTGKRRVRK